MSMIGGKWKPIILFHLSAGTLRFSELRRKIPLITDQMLTQHLREMENHGLVHRQVHAQVPPRVEYSLSESARNLRPILDGLAEWSVSHKLTLTSSATHISAT